ncbi:hypothetical protein F5Y02DRAFT_425549 [Annulohypoxylon stygium]|nr:hypothetical protein F5Y02DRAFT_425549 [Annulohypoxylon stygium]
MSDLNNYTIGWICAVHTEYVAALEFLDEEHEEDIDFVGHNDNNTYTLGRIGKHNVVIASLPHWQYGLVSAATVARDMVRSFPNVRIGLMVGIGGGAPSQNYDIRLGDIVVSSAGYNSGGVFQYDYGKTIPDKKFITTGFLNQPPILMLGAMQKLRAKYERKGHQFEDTITAILCKNPRLQDKYQRPDPSTDRLYKSSFTHAGGDKESCAAVCGDDESRLNRRSPRSANEDNPAIHYGLIASANQLMQDALIRDQLATEKDVLCFEMEAAGLMNHFPCLVIRGICDYCDTHKNTSWQGYAALAAAAYAKDLLNQIAPSKVEAERKLIDILSDVQEDVKKTRTGVESLKQDSHYDRIENWLSPPDPSTNFNNALKHRYKDTGQWFLHSAAYSTWKSESNSFLWLNGIPGCGKTILSSTVIENLGYTYFDNLLYFYFDFNDSSKQHFNNAVRLLISQLYYKREGARKHLDSLYSSCQDGRQQPSLESLCITFQNMVQQAGEVWIVLDALDECSTRTGHRAELLSWIENLQGLQMNTHILVTSRPEQDIKSTIEGLVPSQNIIPIQSDLIKEDIRAFIHASVRKHQGLKRWQSRPDVQDKIETALIEKADGMFRWVSCQLDVLKNCLNYRSVQEALTSLPTTLDETYARILANVPQEHQSYTTRILQFLTYSERPLRIEEAVDAIAVEPANKPRFDPENRMPIPREISIYCSSLVLVTRRETNDQTVTEVQLAHFSVKEYLTSDRLDNEIATDLSEIAARSSIAEVSLAYLLELNHSLKPREIMQSYPMAKYAAQYWTDHAVIAVDSKTELQSLALKLFTCKESFETCYQLYKLDQPWNDRYLQPPSALYYASLGGLIYSVQMLLDKGADMNAQGGFYGNALQAASYGGHEKIVQMLLDKGADMNAQGGFYGNALQAVSEGGHEKIVQMLLDEGADVNAQGGEYDNALLAASYGGHEKIVQMLLDKGADVNAQGGVHSNALQVVSEGGHEKIVQMLLDKGADVNAQGGEYGNALQAASYGGHEKIVQMLLDKGTDVNAQGGFYGNALQAASYGGHEKIVQMLLDKGADVNAQGGLYGNALQAASRRGLKKIV